MPSNSIRLDDAYSAIFGILWLVCCILYPVWYIPKQLNDRFIFFTFLIIYFLINFFIVHKWLHSKLSQFEFRLKINLHELLQRKNTIITFIILSIPAVILHGYLITYPLLPRTDERFYVSRGFALYYEPFSAICNMIPSVPVDFILFAFKFIAFVLICVGFILVLPHELIPNGFSKCTMYIKKAIFVSSNLANKKFKFKIIYIFFAILAFYIYLFVLEFYGAELIQSAYLTLIRFNPLSAILYSIVASLFGFHEATIRLYSVLFSFLSAFYVFRLTRLYRNERTSLFAAVIFLYLPGFFYFGNQALLTTGVVFFMVSSAFYFLRYTKKKDFCDLMLTALLINIGFLWKNSVIVILPIIWMYLILKNLKTLNNFGNSILEYLKLSWISFIPAIPWIYVSQQYRWRNFEFTPSNWIHFDLATAYFSILPSLVTPLIFILFVMGVAYGIWKKRDELSIFLFTWFCVIYIFFTSDSPGWIPCGRFVAPILLVVAVIVAQFISESQDKIRNKKLKNIVFAVVVVYLFCFTSVFTHDICTSEYVPYNHAFKYIQQNVSTENKIVFVDEPGASPLYFYYKKYSLSNDIIEVNLPMDQQNLATVFTYCKENNAKYLLIAPPDYRDWIWRIGGYRAEPNFNESLLKRMTNKEQSYFTLEKTFTLGENKMMLFKVNWSDNQLETHCQSGAVE